MQKVLIYTLISDVPRLVCMLSCSVCPGPYLKSRGTSVSLCLTWFCLFLMSIQHSISLHTQPPLLAACVIELHWEMELHAAELNSCWWVLEGSSEVSSAEACSFPPAANQLDMPVAAEEAQVPSGICIVPGLEERMGLWGAVVAQPFTAVL